MSTYTATVRWSCKESREGFAKGQYSRAHEWGFDGGAVVPASASPHIVPAPWSDPAGVDPEEAFVASLASCHMLFSSTSRGEPASSSRITSMRPKACSTSSPTANWR